MSPGGSYIGELPGMIWDGSKCRYIKAQPSHLATDTQKQVERRKKENEERDLQAAAFVRAKNQSIVRRTTLHDTMDFPTGGSHIDNIRQYNPSIHNKGVALALKGTRFPPNLQEQLLPDTVTIPFFDYHESSGIFVFGIHIPYNTVWEAYLLSARPRSPSQSSNPLLQYEVSPLAIDLPGTGFSSLQITPNNHIIATTYGSGDQRPQVLIIPATNDGSLSITSDVDRPYVNHTMNEVRTIWSCAVNPWASSGIGSTSSETVAIGASGRYFHYRLTNDSSLRHMGVHKTGCDVRAVEWKDINVMAGGANNGKVYLFDVRSNRGSLRLETARHSINGIRFTGTDNHHMVLNGINNFMVMYDLRFPGRMLESLTNPPTKPNPSVIYPYKNPSHYPTAFDISTSLDLVAAAESDVPGIVQVYRLSTGQKLRTLDLKPLSGVANDLHIPHCLRFKRDSTGVPMLLIPAGKNVVRFAV